jgi:hypothetical protein
MNADEHAQTAREFLEASAQEFEAEDILQASEKLWGAATHALMSVGQTEGLPIGSHRELSIAARHFTKERNDDSLYSGFKIAEQFHINFYHGYMDDWQIADGREYVRRFVERLLGELTPRTLAD